MVKLERIFYLKLYQAEFISTSLLSSNEELLLAQSLKL